MINETQNYKWYILILVVLTNMFIIAIPMMGMSVLAKEISDDLNLTLVQVGIIWGVSALPGIITSLLGGAIGDKIGPKRALVAGALLGGLLGAARGLAGGFLSLTIITLLMGVVLPVVLMNGIKVLGQWFPPQQLGLANGAQAMSMALGFMLGSLLSATTFSPWLGGWRNVLIAYGLIGAALSIPWLFTKVNTAYSADGNSLSIGEAVRHVAGLRNVWLLGLGLFGISGAVQGTLGFLPLYLREVGWEPLQADGALSAFHTVSMIFVLPVALWSDRLRFRKPLLLTAGVMIATGVGLLSFVGGVVVWAAVLLAGSVRDGFMAIFQTMVIESERVGPLYAGTAVGFTMALTSIGNLIAPPIGNSLAAWWPGAPFCLLVSIGRFWPGLFVVGKRERASEGKYMMSTKKYTVITGASSGIGYETAKAFAARGKNVIVTARRQERLEALQKEIQTIAPTVEVVIREADLSSNDEAIALYESLAEYNIETWVNNAGRGDHGDIAAPNLSHSLGMLHLNMDAVAIFSSLYVRDYKDREGAQLINVSSIGGYLVVPGATLYCATKFFVSALTEGIDHEMRAGGYKLRAKVLAPASTETEFEQTANELDEPVDYGEKHGRFHTAAEMAQFLLALYDGDKTVGEIDFTTFSIKLSDAKHPHLG